MVLDTQMAQAFYATPRGGVAALLLRERLAEFWPHTAGQSVLGLGYAAPYLRLWRDQARHCVALTPAQIGLAAWPPGGPGLSCTADEDALPFADVSFDRVLMVHALESAEHARRMMREVWRVLRDDGRLLVVAPNRSGMWAHVENSPFGQGQPYSPGQIGRLLESSLFRVERRDTALYVPPLDWRMVLRGARLWERTGRRLLPQFAGVTLSEARKDMFAGMPLNRRAVRRLVLAEAA